MEITISKSRKTKHINKSYPFKEYPKYFSKFINVISETYCKANNRKNIGDLDMLMQEYINSNINVSLEGWESFYRERYPDTIEKGAEKIYNRIQTDIEMQMFMRNENFTHEMIYDWFYELVIPKTYYGFMFQDLILEELAKKYKRELTTATTEDEKRGIDGYLNGIPIQIKPESSKGFSGSSPIGGHLVIYKKLSNGNLSVNYPEQLHEMLK